MMGLPDLTTSKATAPGGTGSTVPDNLYIVSVLLLCTECKEPIKATITTTQWIRCEWIGPSGECQRCYQQAKGDNDATVKRS